MRWIAFSLVLIGGIVSEAGAQTCAGGLSFNLAPLQVGVAPAWSSSSHGIAASVAFGADRLFGGLSTKGHLVGQRNALGFASEVSIGANQPLRRDNRLHVCPIVSAGYVRSSPTTRATVGARLALGWLLHNGERLAVVPTVGAGVGHRTLTGPTDPFIIPADEAASVLEFGVGFIIGSRYVLMPRITFPRGDEDDPMIAIQVSYGLRKP